MTAQRRALALLALLAAVGDRGLSRDRAVLLLWPESDEERGRASLRQLVRSIRSALGVPELLPSVGELRLDGPALPSDVADFRDAVRRRDWREAASHYGGHFLADFSIRGLDELDRVIASERATIDGEAARVFERLADESGRSGDAAARIGWCRRRIDVDPLAARGNVALIEALDAAGDRSAALAHARVYERLLRAELDAPPDPLVLAAVARLGTVPVAVHGSVSQPPTGAEDSASTASTADTADTTRMTEDASAPLPAPAAPEAPRLPSPSRGSGARWLPVAVAGLLLAAVAWGVTRDGRATGVTPHHAGGGDLAVLPFANTSAIATDAPFVDGLTDELISQLGRVPGVRVIGRTSVFALRGNALDVRAVGDTLGVRSVLEGSWRRQGSRLKVTAQLVDAATGAILWSDAFDGDARDVLAAQTAIASRVTTALAPRLGADGQASRSSASAPTAPAAATRDSAAYEQYLVGRHLLRTHTDRAGMELAAARFREAIARDPGYASAHAGLSDAMTRLAVFGLVDPGPAYEVAIDAARRAIALEPGLADAHASLGHALLVARFSWSAADSAFRRAIALDPSLPYARSTYALSLASQERYPEALAQLDTARAADPLSMATNNLLGRILLLADRPHDAIRVLRSVLDLAPHSDLALQQLGHAYLRTGDSAAALDHLHRAARISGARDSAQLAYALATLGRHEDARRIVTSVRRSPSAARALAAHLAMAYTALGQPDSAFAMLERGYRSRASFMIGVPGERAFRPLHGDPRWKRLMERMRSGTGAGISRPR